MEMFDIVLKLIGLVILAIGVVCVYDARKITKKFFSSSKINETTRSVKVVGFIVSVVGCVLVLSFR